MRICCLSWVFAFLIHYTNNPPVQTAETTSEMSHRHYSSKTDGSKLPSTAFDCPGCTLETPWSFSGFRTSLPQPCPFPSDLHRSCLPLYVENSLIREGKCNLLSREHRCVCDALCGSGHLWCLLLWGGSGVSEMSSLLNRTYLFPSVVDFMFCPKEGPACPSVPCDFILRLNTKECWPRGSSLCLCKNIRQLTN